jgi:hypothetical protein
VRAASLPAVGASATPHGAQGDFEVIPLDRQPGLADASYEQHSVSPEDVAYLDFIRAEWQDGGFLGCSASNSEVLGIDRGDDDPGTTVDESLTQYVKSTTINEDVFEVDFYDEGDELGTSTNLNEGDEFVSFTKDCFDNPSEHGWYRIRASLAGTLPDGLLRPRVRRVRGARRTPGGDVAGRSVGVNSAGGERELTAAPTGDPTPVPAGTAPRGTRCPSR